jgi:hypothetical protein
MDYERLKNTGFDGILNLYKYAGIGYREYLDSILSLSKYKKDIIDTQKKGIENAINIIETLKEAIKKAIDIINTLKEAINIIETLKEAIKKAIDIINTLKEAINIIETLKEAIEEEIKEAIKEAIVLGPGTTEYDIETKILMLYVIDNNEIPSNIDDKYGVNVFYDENDVNKDKDAYLQELRSKTLYTNLEKEFKGTDGGGSRRNKATPKSKPKPKAKPKHEDMTMKDIKELCKVNQIKLSKVVEGERVVYKKKELITKLKRKKLL